MLRVDEPAGQTEQMADPVLFENFPVAMDLILRYVFTTDYLKQDQELGLYEVFDYCNRLEITYGLREDTEFICKVLKWSTETQTKRKTH